MAPSVADQVHDNISMEVGAPVGGDSAGAHHGLWVVGVDVQYGRANGFGHVGRVRAGARVRGCRGESQLVVDNDMQGPACCETCK